MRKEEYNWQAQRTIGIIEKQHDIDWNNKQKLTNLTHLHLSNNQITDISPLKELKNLPNLYLSNNQITDVSPLKELTNLTNLGLNNNQIIDVSSLKELINLTHLYLSRNQITDMSALKKLINLTHLYLVYNQISDISPLTELINLTRLDLRSNQITDMSALKELTNLTILNLDDNQITDILALKELTKLMNLDLSYNQIKKIPKELLQLKLEIRLKDTYDGGIFLEGNPIEEPPMYIMEQGNISIQKYYDDLESQGRGKLNEAKLIIVGEPKAGKSSLMECLLHSNYRLDPKQESTMGINVKPWHFPHPDDNEREMRANIWDFGGQQIQYMTHQFFLTPDSLYVLVTANDRKESSNFPYWFKIIHLLGEIDGRYSPVLVVKNKKSDKFHFDFDEAHYKKLYPNLQIEVREVDLEHRQGDFRSLHEKVIEMISKLPIVNDDRPAKWSPIRKDLEAIDRDHINFEEYAKVCVGQGVDNTESQKLLSSSLHHTGSLLHFVKDSSLRDFIILNPQWAVDAVYSVISDTTVAKNRGEFTQEFVNEKWKDYSISEQINLLQLMKKDNFEICYAVANKPDTFIAPQLLPDTAPEYEFDTRDSLKFRFRYKFMPDGIIARLIVRLNKYIEDSLVWKKGVVLTQDNCQAQIIEEDNAEGLKIIDIHINGEIHQRKYLLHTIRKEIESIHDKWFKNIQSEAMIPCNCRECKKNPKPYYFAHSDLQRYLNKNKQTIECRISIEDVSVLSLLEGVSIPKEIKRQKENTTQTHYNIDIKELHTKDVTMGNGNISIGGSNTGVAITGDNANVQHHSGNGDNVNGNKIVDSSSQRNTTIGDVSNSNLNLNTGDHGVATQTITTTNSDLKELLEAFQAEANKVAESLAADKQAEFKGDAETFIEKAQEGKLDKYFNLSKEGLLEAAEAVGEVGVKLAKYIPKILKAL